MIHDAFRIPKMHNKTLLLWTSYFGIDIYGSPEIIYDFLCLKLS